MDGHSSGLIPLECLLLYCMLNVKEGFYGPFIFVGDVGRVPCGFGMGL